jgi:hypothetical protein
LLDIAMVTARLQRNNQRNVGIKLLDPRQTPSQSQTLWATWPDALLSSSSLFTMASPWPFSSALGLYVYDLVFDRMHIDLCIFTFPLTVWV